MYFNNAQCDIYIGTGAGKKLMEEIAAASNSVKIVSPFLSAKLVQGLIELQEGGVHVELITTEPERGKSGLLGALIRQHVHMDQRAQHRKRVLHRILKICYFLVGLGVLALWFFFAQQAVLPVLYILATIGIFGLAVLILHHVLKRVRVFSYSYEPIFPIRMIKPSDAFGKRTTYLHSKIYIIDDRIAYMGSLNFTYSGTESNYETRVRLTDAPSVKKIVQEFHYLMDEADFPELDICRWGSRLYHEPFH
ncbi:phospholipase D-like domain-containing protein [Flagellimonas nanhaiensis]|uniref:phospholipase D n=1 Tax=Flagellimonas nanhaiensis TaxID=2292706 RepID=A0A371JLQ6_9FLAO|nr:phospholipase D-like domain-containing protein [Allomuricauda nanhaiensis]RDY57930.1 hypothetical protein DX873_17440 [Allomuricauda nanhaiensis]